MVIAALKTLTWGTVGTAVVSALMLAWAGGNFPRIASITGDAARGRTPAVAAPGGTSGPGAAPASLTTHAAAPARDAASH